MAVKCPWVSREHVAGGGDVHMLAFASYLSGHLSVGHVVAVHHCFKSRIPVLFHIVLSQPSKQKKFELLEGTGRGSLNGKEVEEAK